MAFRKNLFTLAALAFTPAFISTASAQAQEKPVAPYSTVACVAKELGLHPERDDILPGGRRRIYVSGFGKGQHTKVYLEKFIFIGGGSPLSYQRNSLFISGNKKFVIKNTSRVGKPAFKPNAGWDVQINDRTTEPTPANLTEAFAAFKAAAKCVKKVEVNARNPEPPRVIPPIKWEKEIIL